ncbi:MAG: hypothetical protein OQK24_01525 [Magnetovibrio sp.]|nr:hypothetical protein [Magnetovibrio sp.]
MSIVSLLQALFDVGLYSVTKELIHYYRTLTQVIFNIPFSFFEINLPTTLTDLWTLSFVGSGAYARTAYIEETRFFMRFPALTTWRYWRVLFTFVWGFSGVGLVFLWIMFTPTTYVDKYHEEPLDLMKGAAINFLYVLLGAVAFFALNAFAPSVQFTLLNALAGFQNV